MIASEDRHMMGILSETTLLEMRWAKYKQRAETGWLDVLGQEAQATGEGVEDRVSVT